MVRAVRVVSSSLNLVECSPLLTLQHRRSYIALLPYIVHDAGAVYALASFFAFAAPNARFLLFFVVPMPAWACIGAIACFDAYNAVTRRVRLFRCLAEIPQLSYMLSLKLLSCTVLYFGLGGTRWRTDSWRPLLVAANEI
jgi:hypothetical protein